MFCQSKVCVVWAQSQLVQEKQVLEAQEEQVLHGLLGHPLLHLG